MLIRDGATLVRSADNVIEALGNIHPPQSPELPLPTPAPKQNLRQTADLHSKILQRLGPSQVAEDQLIRDLGAAPTTVAPTLVSLELDGRIRR